MGGWIEDLARKLVDAVLDRLTEAALAALNWVLGLLSATVFSSPDVTKLPQVAYVSGNAQAAANACMVLIVMVVGFMTMAHGVQERYALKDLLPRAVVGFVAANMAGPIVSAAITAANAVTQALAGGRFTSAETFGQMRRVIVDTFQPNPAMFLVALVLHLLALVLLALLVVTWLGRITVLLVVAGTAPVALMCLALPQTEAVARIWWRSLWAVLAVQVLQAVALHMAVATLLTPGANLAALGLPNDPTGLLNQVIACFLLWLVIRIPGWVARNSGTHGGRAASTVLSVAKVVVVQQALRAVGLRGGRLLRGGRRSTATAGVRPPSVRLHEHRHHHTHEQVRQSSPGRPPASPTPGGPRVRPDGGPGPAGTPPAGAGGPARPTSPPPRPQVPPPGAIPLRRPRWQAYEARPSSTGWPTTPTPRPRAAAGGRSGTGWPGGQPEWKTRGSGVRRVR